MPVSVVEGEGFKELTLLWYVVLRRASVTKCINKTLGGEG